MNGIPLRKTIGANREKSMAVFDMQAADGPVRLGLKRIRQA